MLQVKIEDNAYQLISDWSEITIQTAIDYYAIPQPEVLKELSRLLVEDNAKGTDNYPKAYTEVSQRDHMISLPVYYGKVIRLFSNIPDDVLDRIFWRARTDMFETYLYRFCLGLDFSPKFEPSGQGSFMFEGVEYWFPDDRQMAAVEFAEGADLESTGAEIFGSKGEMMARLMAVLCRPKGEKYNEETIKTRIESFKRLPLNLVWEVDFFLTNFLQRYENGIRGFLRNQILKLEKQSFSLDSIDSVGMVH